MKEDKLLSLLQKKKGFFLAVLELTETESSLPLSEWFSVLEQKKILMSCIDEVDNQLHAFKSACAHLTQDVHEEMEEIRHVVEKILYLDQINQEKRKKELQLKRT